MEESHVLIEPRVPSRGAAVLLKALRESFTIGCPLKTVWNCSGVKPDILNNGFYLHVGLCMHLALFRNMCNNTLVFIDHKKWEAKICNFFNIILGLGSKWPYRILFSAFLGFFNSNVCLYGRMCFLLSISIPRKDCKYIIFFSSCKF